MKKLLFLSSVLLVSCTLEQELPDELVVEKTPILKEFVIYKNSFQTHELSTGYYSAHTTTLPDDGRLVVGIAYADFNKDGHVDIVGKDERNPKVIKIYTNDGNGNYNVSILNSENGFVFDNVGPRKIITTDINNDGEIDIVVGLAPDDFENPRGLYIFENKGGGKSFYRHSILTGEHDWIHALATADINNDGYVDIFMSGLNYVFLGNGNFTFTKKDLPNYIRNSVTVELIDMNRDGFVDVLMGYHKPSYDPSAVWGKYGDSHAIHYGTGTDQLFSEAYVLSSNYDGTNITLDFSVIDFDNDGDLDLFTNSNFDYGSKYAIQYYENNGYQNFVNKTKEVFQNECNLVPNHYDIDWIKFVDMNDDSVKELMIEGVNSEVQNGQYISPKFNGFQLNSNGKFERKMLK